MVGFSCGHQEQNRFGDVLLKERRKKPQNGSAKWA